MNTYELLQRLLPTGPYSQDEDADHMLELLSWAEQIDELEDQGAGAVDACFPGLDTSLLSRWETMYGLHPADADSEAVRVARLLEAIQRVPLLTPAYMDAQLEALTGVDAEIIEFRAFHCDDAASLCDVHSLEMQWDFHVALDRAQAVAASIDDELVEEQALLDRIKPGHTDGIVCFDNFLCDDPYSLTDRDLLGA